MTVLLGAEFPGNTVLAEQALTVLVRRIDSNGSLEFKTTPGSPARVVRRIPVEAECEDGAGITIHVLLHVLNGSLNELEIFREDSGLIRDPVDPNRFRIVVL